MLRTAIAAALSQYRDLIQPTSGIADHLRKNADDKTKLIVLQRNLGATASIESTWYLDLATDADHQAESLLNSFASNDPSLSARSISALAALDSELPTLCIEFSAAYEGWLATIGECAEANVSLAESSRKIADLSDNGASIQDVENKVNAAVCAQRRCADAADTVVVAATQLATRLEGILATVDALAANLDA